jgi:hypothetical protein
MLYPQATAALDAERISEMPPQNGMDMSEGHNPVNTLEGSSSDSQFTQDGDTPSARKLRKAEKETPAGDHKMGSDENKIPKSDEEYEYSAPKFMSLVCVMQLVKLMDAVGILFPHTLSEGIQPITSKREFLDQVTNAKMSAHIDCPNCKAFVSYRWYANDVKELKKHLASSFQDSKKVHFCLIYIVSLWRSPNPCRLSAVAVSGIGNASHLVPNLAVVTRKRCVHFHMMHFGSVQNAPAFRLYIETLSSHLNSWSTLESLCKKCVDSCFCV